MSQSGQLPIAIVGAGFSGTLLAVNLVRNKEPLVLIERKHAQVGKGLAFGTRRPEHLLNVRAANMSAFPDDARHFLRWMGFASDDQANRFVPRLAYGQYLAEQLVAALTQSKGAACVREAEACSADFLPDRVRLHLPRGETIDCRALVLALGNFPPPALPPFAGLPPALHVADPWEAGALDGAEALGDVLLVGSGLTAVDIAVSLDRAGHRGRIVALSRRGLRPRGHAESGPVVTPISRPEARGSQLVRQTRERAREVGWRAAVDGLRPHTQFLWRSHGHDEQRRFLRHLRPYWDVHRHRLAPDVAERVARMEAEGRLRFVAGKLTDAREGGGKARVTWRPRGTNAAETMTFARIVSCVGPEGDIACSSDPLVRNLAEQGLVRPDPHRVGLDVDHLGRVHDAQGKPQDRLFAVGPMTKGEAWEIVAVPDIRRQVWDLARYLANAHWVGGEGL